MKKHFLALSVLAFVSAPSVASDFYVNGDLGQSQFQIDSLDDESDTNYSLGVGYQINNNFAIEVNYVDFGGWSESEREALSGGNFYEETYSYDISAIQASLIASWPLNDKFSVYGRLGVADMEVDFTYKYHDSFDDEFSDDYESDSDSKSKTLLGLGLGYSINQALALRVEYAQYDEWNALTLSALKAGLIYRF